jgi:hypothetical protein
MQVMESFVQSLFRSLRRMDDEASVSIDGTPTGLAWYGGFFRPDLKKPQTEPSRAKRLVEILPGEGYPCDVNVRYADPSLKRCKCDIVVEMHDRRRMWIEIKGDWKEFWRQDGRQWIYRSYMLHPLVSGLDAKSHTVPYDLDRLKTVCAADGSSVGCLIVGFDSDEAPMDQDIEELQQLTAFNDDPWKMHTTKWADRYRPGCNVRLWFWHRDMK